MAGDATEECHLPGAPPTGPKPTTRYSVDASPTPLRDVAARTEEDQTMPAETRGSVFKTRNGYGIRWPENGRRPQQTGFATKTEARRWFAENVAPRLRPGGPSTRRSPSTRSATCSSSGTARPSRSGRRTTLEERLGRVARAVRQLDAARAGGRRRGRRRLAGRALRTVALPADARDAAGARTPPCAGATCAATPPSTPAANPQPRTEELVPFTRDEIDAIAVELGPTYGPLVVFAAETGLRTNEWVALERRDVDRPGRAVTVQRRYADGVLTAVPEDGAVASTGAADRAGARRARRAAAAARHAARVPGAARAATSRSTTGAPASGTTRSTPPGSSGAARTTCATRSRPRRSPPASRSSSCPA